MAECFQVKKGSVIVFCFLNITIYIFVAGLVEIIIANEYNLYDNKVQVGFNLKVKFLKFIYF